MGKFGQFFKNALDGAKRGATKIWNAGSNIVQKVSKVARPAVELASKFGGFMKNLPGKAGEIGDMINRGANAIKNITDLLPNSEAKNKINNAIDRGKDYSQNVINRATEGINRFNNITQPWINSAKQISNYLPGGGYIA